MKIHPVQGDEYKKTQFIIINRTSNWFITRCVNMQEYQEYSLVFSNFKL